MPEGIHGVEWLTRTRDAGDLSAWLELMPYARRIGVTTSPDPKGDGLLFRLDPRAGNVGNVMLPALHGGVVAAFMETAATLDLMLATREPRLPRIVDISIDYLRTARLVPTHARCSLLREGRRLANVTVSAWQKEEATPVATARLHFVLDDPEGGQA
ncbi:MULTISPECIES: PaaI family thioesterase [Halomonas]|uniref:PaaI family thioesterase n=2 Tax=Halomonas TaxID=2745 RepID=A0A7X5AMD8_9GAMM|nr:MULTISPECIES: PaaI family thioesterase [Halomonas]MDR5902396.1 PaaI family thioesterase [Halomonas icarae]NAW12779.1 PaaI family thioesterase [Halomonas icarae]TDB02351.1 PaaI family thioesterase [Halomonas marinisediminis]